ncbi:MAG: SHOCT domain-containing protein, partial [Brachybacterium sp.]
SGARSQSFMNQAAARGVQAAGETGGGAGLAMFGAGMGAAGGMVNPVQPWAPPGQQGAPQQAAPQQGAPQQQTAQQQAAPAQDDPVAKLAQYKQMLDQGLISDEDYEAAKKAALGL